MAASSVGNRQCSFTGSSAPISLHERGEHSRLRAEYALLLALSKPSERNVSGIGSGRTSAGRSMIDRWRARNTMG